MSKTIYYILFIILIVVAVVLYKKDEVKTPEGVVEQNPSLLNSVHRGSIAFSYPNDFGLAISQDQVLVKSYIPPCDPDFDYCLYYNGKVYEGKNFESAGIAINIRDDMKSERLCLSTPPDGYDSLTPTTKSAENYSSALFAPIGDAGAGHYASGKIYRLFVRSDSSCYEFETRIGETQFANYPAGTIKQFTDIDRQNVNDMMSSILSNITLEDTKEKVVFP